QGRDEMAANPVAALEPEALGVVRNQCSRYLSPEEIDQFWKALDALGVTPTVRIGLKLLLLLGVRCGELLKATWDEVDFNAAAWTIPVEHQKLTRKQEQTARPWTVPLADGTGAVPPARRSRQGVSIPLCHGVASCWWRGSHREGAEPRDAAPVRRAE